MRSSRPIRCSTTPGFHGRSKSTSRRQNWKFRPSPPASVEIRIDGPSGSRNCATSMSRRSGERSSWKTPGRRPCRSIAPFSRSSDSRWATKTSVFSPGPIQRADCSTSQRTRGSSRSASAARAAVSSSSRSSTASRAAGEARARKTRSALRRLVRAFSAGRLRRWLTSRSVASHPPISIGSGTRGGRPPMSTRRVELVQGGGGSPAGGPPRGGAGAGGERRAAGQPLVERLLLGEFLRPQELEQAEEAVGVVLQRRGGEQENVAAQGRYGRYPPGLLVARMRLGSPQVLLLVDHQQVDPRRDRL